MEAVFDALIFSISDPFRPAASAVKRGLLHIHDHFIPHPRNNYHPHVLGHRSLALSSILLVSVKICTIVLLTAGPVIPAFSSAITPENILTLTNQSRADYGFASLTTNDSLAKAAQAKADALLACNCFQHNLPDGRTPWDFIKDQKYNYIVAGENLAVDFAQAENVENAWMNSPGHRANILNKNFEQIGIGISEGQFQGHDAIFVVQMFGTPMSQPLAVLNTPTVVSVSQSNEPPARTARPENQAPKAPQVAHADSSKPESVPQVINPPISPRLAAADPATIPSAQSAPVAISVLEGEVKLENNQANISVTTQGEVSKVIANFEGEAIMLSPKSNGTWQGSIDLKKLTDSNKSVSVTAYDIYGNEAGKVLAGFSSDVGANYNLGAANKPAMVSFFGWQMDPKVFENKFYLLFAATILTSLVLAIAVRRHVQHLSMIANGSFVAIFAMLLWMSG